MAEQQQPTAEDQTKLAEAFETAAISFAATPVAINRFILLPTESGQRVLVLGGGALVLKADKTFMPIVRPLLAISILKNVAEDLTLHLEHSFGITGEDRAKAQERNKHLLKKQ